MIIAVIGPGNVGATLGRRFSQAGHEVRFGAPEPEREKFDELRDLGCAVLPPREAAQGAEAILLATPWPAVEAAIASLGDIKGALLIDATNPIRDDFSDIDHDSQRSGGERVAELAAEAQVVKAFNTVGFNVMADPDFDGQRAALAVAGGDPKAKNAVCQLARDIGFEPYDAGPLAAARSTERLAWHWIEMAMMFGRGRDFAFTLVDR